MGNIEKWLTTTNEETNWRIKKGFKNHLRHVWLNHVHTRPVALTKKHRLHNIQILSQGCTRESTCESVLQYALWVYCMTLFFFLSLWFVVLCGDWLQTHSGLSSPGVHSLEASEARPPISPSVPPLIPASHAIVIRSGGLLRHFHLARITAYSRFVFFISIPIQIQVSAPAT